MPDPYMEHLLTHFNHDEYGEVQNGEKTYDAIVTGLRKYGSVVIGWTDNAGNHMDIMFTHGPIQVGSLQRGMNARTDLFVTVYGCGGFGFEIKDDDLHPGYVAEKLQWGSVDVTVQAIAHLIAQVRKRLL